MLEPGIGPVLLFSAVYFDSLASLRDYVDFRRGASRPVASVPFRMILSGGRHSVANGIEGQKQDKGNDFP